LRSGKRFKTPGTNNKITRTARSDRKIIQEAGLLYFRQHSAGIVFGFGRDRSIQRNCQDAAEPVPQLDGDV